MVVYERDLGLKRKSRCFSGLWRKGSAFLQMPICSSTAEILAHCVCVCFSSNPDGVCSSAIRGLDVNVTGDSSILCTRVK